MARPRKKRRQPSIITSDVDHRFSLSEGESDTSAASNRSSDVLVPSKRSKRATVPHTAVAAIPAPIPAPAAKVIKVDYVTSIFSTAEMKKAVSKRLAKNSSFQLQTDEPWDTLKAQLLAKIATALNPPVLDFTNYNVMVTINRVIAKPGIPLSTDADYTMLLNRITNTKAKDTILANVTITQPDSADNKENEPGNEGKEKAKKKAKDPALLPHNVEKADNIQALQKHWICPKKQVNCLGTFCFINAEGLHVALGNERLDCWAAAMVYLDYT